MGIGGGEATHDISKGGQHEYVWINTIISTAKMFQSLNCVLNLNL